MESHKTVALKLGRRRVPIDVKLAPLIRLLWDRGVTTTECCQESKPGLAEIEFPATADAETFLYVAQRDYRVEVETWDEGFEGEHFVRVRLYVLFPAKDIPRLVKAFRAYRPEGAAGES